MATVDWFGTFSGFQTMWWQTKGSNTEFWSKDDLHHYCIDLEDYWYENIQSAAISKLQFFSQI